MFVKRQWLGFRVFALLCFSVSLMVNDHYGLALKALRANLSCLVVPLQYLVDLPGEIISSLTVHYTTHSALLASGQQLQESQLLLRARSEKLWALEQENRQLRVLLHAMPQAGDKTLVAQLLGVRSSAYQHEVLINKGTKQQVYVGQPVVDAYGLMGQVIQAQHHVSRVMLITDTRSAVPVMINRNGMRAILTGNGDATSLSLLHVPPTSDVRVGDWLMTSGLDSNYAAGYPVAVVNSVNRDTHELFLTVTATPVAAVNRSRYVVLIWQNGKNKIAPGMELADTLEKQPIAIAANPNPKPLYPLAKVN